MCRDAKAFRHVNAFHAGEIPELCTLAAHDGDLRLIDLAEAQHVVTQSHHSRSGTRGPSSLPVGGVDALGRYPSRALSAHVRALREDPLFGILWLRRKRSCVAPIHSLCGASNLSGVGCSAEPRARHSDLPTNGTSGIRVNAVDLPELLVLDAGGWRRWLRAHHADSLGVWLVLAKKGTADPTTLSYEEALDEAICFGWIDGQLGRRDSVTFRRRFTPRKARSPWSQRNAGIAERLIATGRMHRSGEDEVRQAKEDGRWEAAYAGQASIEVPADLLAALSANARAKAMFEMLTRANRYAILYRIGNAKKAETRSRRIDQFVEMLARGETIHPQAP